ncbi:beta-ketoacyl-ACP synthase II [Candidatus Zixiibacteriota bacterium]
MVELYRESRPRRRVVITGIGAITPLGHTVEETWDALVAGRSGAGPITHFDAEKFDTRIACEVKDFDPATYFDRREIRRMDRFNMYAMIGAAEALKNANLDAERVDGDRVGVIVGSGIGGIATFEEQHRKLLSKGPGRVSPFFIPLMIVDMSSGLISMRYGFRGPNYATVSACATSAHAIADSLRIIERGDADVIITGGAEATITPASFAGFCANKAISTRNEEPEKASRPFDKDRDGFVMGEGGVIVVLEALDYALKREAPIIAELMGAGLSGDAHHMTAPAPDGNGAARAMVAALADAEWTAADVDFINSHGTSTGLGDIAETTAIKTVFGERAHQIPVNATKSMAGHLLGAAGSLELMATIKTINTGVAHPTINQENPDPECDLDYIPNISRQVAVMNALSNSFGFGGHNVTLAVRGYSNSNGC